MTKLEAIINGRKLTEKLFGLKRSQVKRALEAAKDNAEKQKEDASVAYDELFAKMADEDADYQSIINAMLCHKQLIISADEAIEAIKKDLDTEIPEAEK